MLAGDMLGWTASECTGMVCSSGSKRWLSEGSALGGCDAFGREHARCILTTRDVACDRVRVTVLVAGHPRLET